MIFSAKCLSESYPAMQIFEQCLEQKSVLDGVISQSEAQAAVLWRYREG